MAPAQKRLQADLAAVEIRDPEVPLVNNVDASVVRTAAACRDGLVRQVSAPVRWQQCVETLVREGVETFVEIGPGAVLSGLIKRIEKSARVLNVEDPSSLDRALPALAAAAAHS